jgi:hypothetical protein
MLSNLRMPAAVLVATMCGAAACDDGLAPKARPPLAVPQGVTPLPPPRAMSRAETDTMLAHAASRGDSAAGLALRRRSDLDHGRMATPQRVATSPDPSDPATWGVVQILSPEVLMSLYPVNEAYVLADMYHNGHVGEIDLSFTIRNSQGQTLQSVGPEHFSKTRWGLVTSFDLMQASMQIYPSAACGLSGYAGATFRAYWTTFPFPVSFGAYTLPIGVYGKTTVAAGPAYAEQPPCASSSPGGYGGENTNGSGYWLTYTECSGFDYYINGYYVYSTITSCWASSTFIYYET